MDNHRRIVTRVYSSPVAWYWAFNGLRMASGVLLLPLLVKLLPKPDFGMYYVFLSLAALIPILDFGFSVSIGRAVSYAMGGATELKAEGYVAAEKPGGPNYALLWQLLHTTRVLYRWLSLGAFLFLSLFGTYMVALRVGETTAPRVTWIAWGVTLLAALVEIYAGWWNTFLRSMDKVVLSARQASLAYAVKLALSCLLLLLGAGLLSVPAAGLVSSLLVRQLSRRSCLRLLGQPPATHAPAGVKAMVATLWPNSWKLGLQFLSNYLSSNANTLICQTAFGLAASAEYGLSLQLVSISASMATVWTTVKWPLVGQYRTRQDYGGLQKILRPRLWLQLITYAALAASVVVVAPSLLRQTGSGKTILPGPWMALLAFNALLDINCSFWSTLISTENRMPFMRPMIITNICSLALALTLLKFTRLGLLALVVAPLLTGSVFNYWYWPLAGAKSIKTRLFNFMFVLGQRRRPAQSSHCSR